MLYSLRISSVLLFLELASVVESKINMVLMWGYPTLTYGIYTFPVENWNSCVNFCSSDIDCVMAYSEDKFNTVNCRILYFGLIKNVQLFNNTDGISDPRTIAVKMNTADQCFLSQTDNFPAQGKTATGTYSVAWNNITDTLVFTYVIPPCFGMDGWVTVRRKTGDWCMTLTMSASSLTSSNSRTLCNEADGILTGIASSYEAMFFNYWMKLDTSVISQAPDVWVDGIRNCTDSDGKPNCETFNFVGNYMPSPFDNNLFLPGQPAENDKIAIDRHCLSLVSSCGGDGSQCLSNKDCDGNASGYICGREAAP